MKKFLHKCADAGIVAAVAIFGGLLMLITAINMLIKKAKNK